MSELEAYLQGYSDGRSDATRGLPVTCDEGESREYADGYLAGYADCW